MPRPDDRWFEAIAKVDARDAEAVADAMRACNAAGVVIEPALAIIDSADFVYEEWTDMPWTVRGTFMEPFGEEEEQALHRAVGMLELHLPVALECREAEVIDWAEEWKKFYRIQHIGSRLVVRPSWEPYEARPGEVVMDLDPGAAFGTGEHETTRLCLAALEHHLREGDDVLDVGAGSGILAIAARLLGAGAVRAVDIDPDTVAVAVENARRNGVETTIEFAAGSVGADWPWPDASATGAYDVVLANISSTVIGSLVDHLATAVREDGLLIASGFILRDRDEVRDILARAGFGDAAFEEEGNWGCFAARRG